MNEITEKQYALIRPDLPVQHGNVRVSNLTVINAILFVAENGCKWRALPEHLGNWHPFTRECVAGRTGARWIGCLMRFRRTT